MGSWEEGCWGAWTWWGQQVELGGSTTDDPSGPQTRPSSLPEKQVPNGLVALETFELPLGRSRASQALTLHLL